MGAKNAKFIRPRNESLRIRVPRKSSADLPVLGLEIGGFAAGYCVPRKSDAINTGIPLFSGDFMRLVQRAVKGSRLS